MMHFLRPAALLSYLLLAISSLDAAGPITNSYFANRFLDRCPHYTPAAKKAFLSGVLFPNIQHILPHDERMPSRVEEEVSLDRVRAESSAFNAGLLFHHFLNAERERYHENSDLYESMKQYGIHSPQLTIDFWEDEQLYSYKNGREWSCDTSRVYPEEQASGIPISTIKSWHKMMAASALFPPSKFLIIAAKLGKSFGSHTPQELMMVHGDLKKLSGNKRFAQGVANMVRHFETLFDEQKGEVRRAVR